MLLPHPSRSRVSWLLPALATILLASLLAWPTLRAYLQSAALLDLVQTTQPDWLMRHTVLSPVREEETVISTPSGPLRARIYTPTYHPNAPGVLLLHGVHHLGINEPRMVAFARAFAACGVRVLTPQLPDLADDRVTPATISQIGDSARWFSAHTHSPVGVMGTSFSGGLALMAAARPEYSPAFRYVFTVGSHSSMHRVVSFFLSGSDPRPDGSIQSIPPHEYGALLIEYLHPEDFIPSPADRAAIFPVMQAHLYEQPALELLRSQSLTPAQLALAHTLFNTRAPQVVAMLAASVARHPDEMDAVSPAGHLANLHTPVYLLHGEADNVIPAAELLWLQRDLPAGTVRAALVSPLINHVELKDAAPSFLSRLRTRWQLVHLFARVLAVSERHA